MTHVDKDCAWFFALHFGGRKEWTVREWHIGAKAAGKRASLGDFFDAKERFQDQLQAGELLLWPPWLPHAARVLDENTYSINGHTQLVLEGSAERNRAAQRALDAKHLAQPAACQGSESDESKYLFGDNPAEGDGDDAEGRQDEMMSMEEATSIQPTNIDSIGQRTASAPQYEDL